VLLKKHAGDMVNLENDIVGKYVEKLLSNAAAQSGKEPASSSKGLSLEYLQANGF
jgi:riboflavin synthase